MRIAVLFDRRQESQRLQFGLRQPRCRMRLQGATVGIAQQSGAVIDFRWQLPGGTQRLVFSDGRKPLPEGLTVSPRIKMQERGRAVGYCRFRRAWLRASPTGGNTDRAG